MEFVQKFTTPDFKVKNFTPSISPYFNSFSGKKHKKWVKMENFTPLAKILHCRWQWQHWQISPLFKAPIDKPRDYHIFNWRAKPCWKHEFQTGFSNTFKYKPKCVLIIIDIASYHIWPHLIIIDITSDNLTTFDHHRYLIM